MAIRTRHSDFSLGRPVGDEPNSYHFGSGNGGGWSPFADSGTLGPPPSLTLALSGIVKRAAKIEAFLTALAVVFVWGLTRVGVRVKSMPESDPVRQLWESRLALPCEILWYGILFPWLAFSVFFLILAFVHFAAWTLHKLTDEGRT